MNRMIILTTHLVDSELTTICDSLLFLILYNNKIYINIADEEGYKYK